MEGKLGDSTFVHSPGTHYHSQLSKRGLNFGSSNSDNGEEESDVSDMVVDDPSRFQRLSKQRKKSGGSDYRPQSESNSASESESGSPTSSSEESYSTRSTPFSAKARSTSARLSGEESEGTSSRSLSIPPPHQQRRPQVKSSPLVRKSPLSVSHRSSPSEVTAMRGYRYSMLPSRSAAMNVSYSRYLDEGSDSEDDTGFPAVGKRPRRRQLKESESEFEMSGASEGSASEEISYSEDYSEEDYRPPRKRGRGGRRKVCVCVCVCVCL